MGAYNYKRFDELEDALDWLNQLEDTEGVFYYTVVAFYATPRGVYVVLSGQGRDWEARFDG